MPKWYSAAKRFLGAALQREWECSTCAGVTWSGRLQSSQWTGSAHGGKGSEPSYATNCAHVSFRRPASCTGFTARSSPAVFVTQLKQMKRNACGVQTALNIDAHLTYNTLSSPLNWIPLCASVRGSSRASNSGRVR